MLSVRVVQNFLDLTVCYEQLRKAYCFRIFSLLHRVMHRFPSFAFLSAIQVSAIICAGGSRNDLKCSAAAARFFEVLHRLCTEF